MHRSNQRFELLALLLQALERNAECEKHLLEMLGSPNPDGEGALFGNVTLEQLEKKSKCAITRLQASIHAQSWSGTGQKREVKLVTTNDRTSCGHMS